MRRPRSRQRAAACRIYSEVIPGTTPRPARSGPEAAAPAPRAPMRYRVSRLSSRPRLTAAYGGSQHARAGSESLLLNSSRLGRWPAAPWPSGPCHFAKPRPGPAGKAAAGGGGDHRAGGHGPRRVLPLLPLADSRARRQAPHRPLSLPRPPLCGPARPWPGPAIPRRWSGLWTR